MDSSLNSTPAPSSASASPAPGRTLGEDVLGCGRGLGAQEKGPWKVRGAHKSLTLPTPPVLLTIKQEICFSRRAPGVCWAEGWGFFGGGGGVGGFVFCHRCKEREARELAWRPAGPSRCPHSEGGGGPRRGTKGGTLRHPPALSCSVFGAEVKRRAGGADICPLTPLNPGGALMSQLPTPPVAPLQQPPLPSRPRTPLGPEGAGAAGTEPATGCPSSPDVACPPSCLAAPRPAAHSPGHHLQGSRPPSGLHPRRPDSSGTVSEGPAVLAASPSPHAGGSPAR